MKTHTPILTLLVWGGLLLPLAADTYLLQNGEKLDAQLLKELDDAYLLEVMIGTSIRDERLVPKADVVSIEKSREDFKLFEEIKRLLPTPDGLSTEDYEDRVRKVSEFTTSYPLSPKVNDALEILLKLREEMREVAKGGVKLDGMLYSAESREANAYEIDSKVEASSIRQLIAKGRLLRALRAFAKYEQDYAPTMEYNSLLPAMTEVAQKYQRQLRVMLETYNSRVAQRKDGLKTMSVNGRMDSVAALEEQDELLMKRFEAESAAQLKWVTPHPFCKPALQDGLRNAESFISKMKSKPEQESVDGGRMYREALSLAHSGENLAEVKRLIDQAERDGMADRYIEVLRNALEQATTSAEEALKQEESEKTEPEEKESE